jgi:predicted RND superfamily exporter protein
MRRGRKGMGDMASADLPDRNWRNRIEGGFERWGYFIYRNRWSALAISILVTGWLISYLPGLTVDNSTESFLLPDDPAVIVYNDFRDQFGRDDRILLAVAAPELFSLDFLERLRELHETIEAEVPYVEEVDSLLNARVIRGEENQLIVEELLEQWPQTPEDLERIRDYVMSNPLYLNALVSADGSMTAIAITPDTYTSTQGESQDDLRGFESGDSDIAESPKAVYLTDAEGDAVIAGLFRIVDRFDAPDFKLHLAGALVMTYRMNQGTTRDFLVFIPATLVLMCIVLAALFRRVGGVILPLLVVVLSLVATIGIMVAMEIPGSAAVQILPIFLLTVGVCDAVHILAIVYRLRMNGESKADAIAHALGHSGLAVLMTSLTTAVGMGSFVMADMGAIKQLGLLSPIGVALAFVYTMILLPSVIAIFPLPRAKIGQIGRGTFPFEGLLVAAGTFAARSPFRILLPASLITILAVLGALQTTFSHDVLSWFPEHDRVRTDFTAIDQKLGGSISLEVVIDTREPGGLYDPDMLEQIERVSWEIENLAADPIVIGKTLSILDVVRDTHQALNENRLEMRRIPETREAVAQELLLFENSGSDDTEKLVDSEFRIARLNLRVPFCDALVFPPFLEQVDRLIQRRLGDRVDFELTGLMMLLAEIFDSMIRSMMRSYAFALLVITPLMMLLLGSFRRGLVSMIPNLMPVVAVLGIMGWLGVPLDSTTMMVGAMVIGIAVDDTIHFMHKFHRYFEETGDLETAVAETMRTTGSAMLFTSLVLVAGFSVFGLSELTNVRIFGLLSAFAAVVAFLADLVVAPALLAAIEQFRSLLGRDAIPAAAKASP